LVRLPTDLDGFLTQIAKQYFSVINARLRAALPHHLITGPDALYFPNRPGVYSQMASYLDAVLAAGTENFSVDGGGTFPGVGLGTAATTTAYNSLGLPIIAYNLIIASNDSQFIKPGGVCTGVGIDCATDQKGRGELYSSFQQQWLNNYVGGDGYGYNRGNRLVAMGGQVQRERGILEWSLSTIISMTASRTRQPR